MATSCVPSAGGADQVAHHIQSGQDLIGPRENVIPGGSAARSQAVHSAGRKPLRRHIRRRPSRICCHADLFGGIYACRRRSLAAPGNQRAGAGAASLGQLGDTLQLRQVVDDERAGLCESGLQIPPQLLFTPCISIWARGHRQCGLYVFHRRLLQSRSRPCAAIRRAMARLRDALPA